MGKVTIIIHREDGTTRRYEMSQDNPTWTTDCLDIIREERENYKPSFFSRILTKLTRRKQ